MVDLDSESAPKGAVDGRSVPRDAAAAGWLAGGACEVWGVLNVTPDSFSDGGRFLELGAALEGALRMHDAGAHVIDVGGESTRPRGLAYGTGAAPVTVEEELRRVLPVVEALASRGLRVSVDTSKAEVARRACQAGASIVNDVSCGRNPQLLAAVSESGAELVLMHNRGQGECSGDNVVYRDVVLDVRAELEQARALARAAGVARERIWFDPGIGFAKTARQSLLVLARLEVLLACDQRVLVGASRKSFIAELAPAPSGAVPGVGQRLGGTAAAVAGAVLLGAHAVRVHDVAEMRQAALVAARLREARQ